MTISEQLALNLKHITSIARLAPSVHNTQPWHIQADDDALLLTLNPDHVLQDGDPTGRETSISMGIFAEAVIIAAADCGIIPKAVEYKEKKAKLTFEHATAALPNTKQLIGYLHERCTDRSIYQAVAIDEASKQAIRTSYSDAHVTIHVIDDKPTIEAVANLTSKAISVALSSPSFRQELAEYLVLPGSHKKRGISVKSLYIPRAIALIQPRLLKHGLRLADEAALEKQRWLSASGLIIITADGDMPNYWFKAGRAYLRASLMAEKYGFSQATSAAIVEASNYHEDIEEFLGTKQRILSIMRIGKGSEHRYYSPRVSTEEIITSK